MQKSISYSQDIDLRELFGINDEYLKIVESSLGVTISIGKNEIYINGEPSVVLKSHQVLSKIIKYVQNKEVLDSQAIEYLIYQVNEGNNKSDLITQNHIVTTFNGEIIKPKTQGQVRYIKKIESNTVTFGVGPAGTGKTFLAVAMAAKMYKTNQVKKIIITRPAIEAGESLGFLPGDLQDKVDPYLRPLYDALSAIFGLENYQKMKEKQIIEVAPLAYMRGRTLDDSFIILDEAQNTTISQMKMFLTRFGNRSKVVVNGDVTQIDLPRGKTSGLKHAVDILENVKGISVSNFSSSDVVRNPLVKEIIARYENVNRDN